MDPNQDEFEYAEKQISEAKRRLADVKNRVGKEYLEITPVKTEGNFRATFGTYKTPSDSDPPYEMFTEDREIDHFEEETVTEVDEELVGSHIQNTIIDCQLCIELAVKSMFKLTGKDHPFSHSITFDNGQTQGFYSEIPDDFEEKSDIVRVIFLTQFWGEFYELAKYGAPKLNVSPEMIFETRDGSQVVKDAEFCISVAEDLLAFVEKDSN